MPGNRLSKVRLWDNDCLAVVMLTLVYVLERVIFVGIRASNSFRGTQSFEDPSLKMVSLENLCTYIMKRFKILHDKIHQKIGFNSEKVKIDHIDTHNCQDRPYSCGGLLMPYNNIIMLITSLRSRKKTGRMETVGAMLTISIGYTAKTILIIL
ncbi:MAG: hypothetical protein ABJJ97_01635 [Ekhidna sp.]